MEKLEAKKMVNNETPKLGEEVEYRISFKKYGRTWKANRGKDRR